MGTSTMCGHYVCHVLKEGRYLFVLIIWVVRERARGLYLARSGLPVVSRKKIVFFFHIINPLFTKLVRSRWLDNGLIPF